MKTNQSATVVAGRVVRPLASILVCGTIAFIAGCASEPESHLVSAPPPPPPASVPTIYSAPAPVYSTPTTSTTVYTTPQGTVAAVPSPVGASSIVVMQAPPAAQQE